MRIARGLFLAEVVVNACSGPFMVFAPRLALGPLLCGANGPVGECMGAEAEELGRWFGVMVFAFGAVLLGRALRGDPAALSQVLLPFLCGDVVYTLCSARWTWRTGYWSAAAIFNLAFSSALFGARIAAMRDIQCALPEGCEGSGVVGGGSAQRKSA